MKNILILNGCARPKGATTRLVKAFREGAESAGNKVQEFYLYGMDIHDCRGCLACQHSRPDAPNPCVISDDMTKIYQAFDASDVIIFASPIYWWTMTGTLKTAIDRLFALQMSRGLDNTKRESVLIMTAGGRDFSNPTSWYENLHSVLGWRDLGTILGAGKEDEARKLGASIG